MSRRLLTIFVATVMVMGLFEPLRAGQQRIPSLGGGTARRAAGNAAGGGNTSLITGQVLNADRAPFAFARVHLRNLDSGAVMDQTSADHVGEFSFMVPGRGMYIAELYDETGSVLAAGQAVTVEAGQTVGTVIFLPTKIPTLAGLFGNSAASVMSAAAGAGITAVSSTGEPLSPEQ